jgi:hypothetical protein
MRHSPARPLLATAAIAVAILVAACGSAAAPVPSERPATPPPSVGTPTPPTATPSPAPVDPAPVDPTPIQPTPKPTQPPAKPRPPQPTPPPMNEAEKELVERVRPDIRENCTPRRTDLPKGATAGIECRPASAIVARVGIYDFPDDRSAALAYFQRLADYGVKPITGDCWIGRHSDGAWTPGDLDPDVANDPIYGIVYDGKPYSTRRAGCFIDEGGHANFRATCGDGLYIGVLGRTDDIAKLTRWTWEYAPGIEAPTPMPPGICMGES